MRKAHGFTLVELIAVIVILGVLAVSAIPQFLDLRTNARNSTAAGVGGALDSASAINYARGISQGGATQVTSCGSPELASLVGGTYSFSGGVLTVGGNTFVLDGTFTNFTPGARNTCTITHGGGGQAQSFLLTVCFGGTC